MHVPYELVHLLVFILGQVVLDSSKVHGVLNDGGVVRNVQFHGVHRFQKDVGSLHFHKYHQKSFCSFVPVVVDGRTFIHLRDHQSLYRTLLLEVPCKIRVLNLELVIFLLGEGDITSFLVDS